VTLRLEGITREELTAAQLVFDEYLRNAPDFVSEFLRGQQTLKKVLVKKLKP
jgi:hypothetical protein